MATKAEQAAPEERTKPSTPKLETTTITLRVGKDNQVYEVQVMMSNLGPTSIHWNDAFRSIWELKGFLSERWPTVANVPQPNGQVAQIPMLQYVVAMIDLQAQREAADEQAGIGRSEKPRHPADDMKPAAKAGPAPLEAPKEE